MTDVVGNPEEERRAEFYFQPWAQEAVCRYFYSKVGAVPGAPKGGDTQQAQWCWLPAFGVSSLHPCFLCRCSRGGKS